ncbi:MAG: alpha/beta hydrolase fold domain-containing protein [Planctomycetaceae bacterium]
MRYVLLLIAVVLAAPTSAFAQSNEFRRDVVYAKRRKLELKVDIAFPKDDQAMRPAVLCLHGGGWFGGDKRLYHSRMKALADQGFVAVTAQYRLSGVARWPAQLEDVKTAFRWIVDNAKDLKIDPERIGVMGESAGAHLAMCLAFRPEETSSEVRPRVVLNCFGPTDMHDASQIGRGRHMIEALLGKKLDESADELIDISPAKFIDRTDPPVLTIHGTADGLVPYSQAGILKKAMDAAKIPNDLFPMEGVGHGYGRSIRPAMNRAMQFGSQYLRVPQMKLVAFEDFENGTDRWEFTDDSAWAAKSDAGRTFISLTKKKSDYQPEVRSPFNVAMLKSDAVGSFVLDVDMRSTNKVYGHQDLCLFFGHQDPSHFYYVHLGRAADDHANSIFLVNGEPRVSIAQERTKGTDWSRGWHRVRVKRDAEAGMIEVFFDDMQTPVMRTVDKTFTSGRIGIGSFDDTGDFDAIRLWAKR